MNVSVTPISPLRERNSEEGSSSKLSSPIDSKVRGVVLELICNAKGGLFASACAPQILIDLLPAVENAQMDRSRKEKRKSKLKKTPLIRKGPIGLQAVDQEGWLNSLMQFILFIPGLAESFYFAPRSFYPFHEFIDQYFLDQQENKTLSTANGAALFRFLNLRLPVLSLHEIFQFLIEALDAKWTIHETVDAALKASGANDLFIAEATLKKQFFIEKELFCYDLDAFIELRPDGSFVYFVAYVKVDGTWYQCDDDRITQLRSNCLNIALNRAVFLHYRRVDLGRKGTYFKN